MPAIVLILYHVLMLFALVLARNTLTMPQLAFILPLLLAGSYEVWRATRPEGRHAT